MFKVKLSIAAACIFSAYGLISRAGDTSTSEPRPIPLTRPEMKQLLEDMKDRRLRIPLPELTAEDREKLGERAGNYESRLRYHYLPQGVGFGGGGSRPQGGTGGTSTTGGAFVGGEFSREPDPQMTLDYPFKTKMFWIVSRTNNCQYCLGHQEIKLSLAGVLENEIAALDSDWTRFTPAEQAAFAFARKMTFEPHQFTDADIDGLRMYYKDLQILEIIFSVSGNNSINRWKEGAGIPQERTAENFVRRTENIPQNRPLPIKSFLTPTDKEFSDRMTKVAAVTLDSKTGAPSRMTVCKRPPLEPRAEVEKLLAQARQRKPRLPLVDEAAARALLPEDWPAGPLPQWVRLMANFTRDGKTRILTTRSSEERGELKPLLKAQVAWIIARQDRAWYATGLAKRRLLELGQSEDQVYQLDGDWKEFSPADRSLFKAARKLAATPIVLTDDDVSEAIKLTSPRDVVQLISYVTGRASFDRVTEAAGLQLEN